MQPEREYELKFQIDRSAVDRLLAHPLLVTAPDTASKGRLVSTYFDTPDAMLRRHRVSLRVRRAGPASIHTLKHVSGSLVDRGEWECDNADARPDLAWLQSTPLQALFKKKRLAKHLAPVFTVEVTRTVIPIAFEGATIEGAFDLGEVRALDRAQPICEFELELKAGPVESLLAFARRLATDLPLVLSFASKSERGYGITDSTSGTPTKALNLDLTDGMTLAQAFEAIIQACLHALLVNAALIGGPETFEATHKARIALRRLRAALQLFKPVLRPKRLDGFAADLKWISEKLGRARDADVFQADVFDKAEDAAIIPGAAALAGIMRDDQCRALEALMHALGAPRWRLLLIDLLAFSSDGVIRSERDQAYEPFVAERLAHRRRAVVKHAKHLPRQSSESLHDLRKRAKMLRYDLDFFDRVETLGAGTKAFRTLQKDLQTLQEVLGTLHDGDAARDHLLVTMVYRERPADVPADTWASATFAAGMIAAAPADAKTLLRRAAKAAHRLAAAKLL